jgi:hypothetical protein
VDKVKVDTEGVGTKKTGYAGAEYGPFRCSHCVWFKIDKSTCGHPEVIADPEVPKTQDGKLAVVQAGGCCNEFRPNSKLGDVKFTDVGL